MAVEEAAQPEVADFADVIYESLVAIQADEHEVALEPVARALTARRRHILDRVALSCPAEMAEPRNQLGQQTAANTVGA